MKKLTFMNVETEKTTEIQCEEWRPMANKDGIIYRVNAWVWCVLDTSKLVLVGLKDC